MNKNVWFCIIIDVSSLLKYVGNCFKWYFLFQNERCDARTKLEAQAYTAWMHGTLHFELQLWTSAAENLKKAQVVYEKLSTTLPDDEQAPYRQRIEEITPSLRYCAYNIGDDKAINLLELRSQGLLENIDNLALQAKERRAEELMEITWNGMKVIVRPEKCKLFLMSIKTLDETLKKADDTQTRISMIEEMLIDCRDAVSVARDEVRANSTGAQLLLTYLLYIRLTRTVQRNEFLIVQARKTQDIVRLYDIILQQMNELKELSGLEENKKYQDEITARANMYRAFRCFQMAKSLTVTRRWRESLLLYKTALKYIQAVTDSKGNKDLKEKVLQLRTDIQSSVYVAQAHCVIEDTDETPSEPSMFKDRKILDKTPLIERLDEYREDTQLLTRNPNVVDLPPAMEPIPCRPLFYDIASNLVKFPDLTDELEQEEKKPKASVGMTGFVKGLFGWGGK